MKCDTWSCRRPVTKGRYENERVCRECGLAEELADISAMGDKLGRMLAAGVIDLQESVEMLNGGY